MLVTLYCSYIYPYFSQIKWVCSERKLTHKMFDSHWSENWDLFCGWSMISRLVSHAVALWKNSMFDIEVLYSLICYLLRWRHNDHAGVSNHQSCDCLLNPSFRRRSKKTSKLRVTGLCAGISPGTCEFPVQRASYAESVSIWWRHHDRFIYEELPKHSRVDSCN